MRRIDWQLVGPLRADDGRGEELVEELRRVEEEAASRPEDQALLARLRELDDACAEASLSPCEAVGAPLVGDDPDWETRVIDEFAGLDLELELEEYLGQRSREPDCERCPYATPYSLYPMAPCEFAAGGLEEILRDAEQLDAALAAMGPEAMAALATSLDQTLRAGHWLASEVLEVPDYLEKAVCFLRFWSEHGFGVEPVDGGASAAEDDDAPHESGPATYH